MVPSDLVIVLRSLAFTPPDPVTEDAVTGGHAPAHAPVHADCPMASFTHKYTARPEPVVRNVAPPELAVVITIGPELLPPDALPLAADPAAAGELLLLLPPPLLHAARSAAAIPAPAIAPSLTGVIFELRIRHRLQHAEGCSAFSLACRSNYAGNDARDWTPGNFFPNGPASSRTSADCADLSKVSRRSGPHAEAGFRFR